MSWSVSWLMPNPFPIQVRRPLTVVTRAMTVSTLVLSENACELQFWDWRSARLVSLTRSDQQQSNRIQHPGWMREARWPTHLVVSLSNAEFDGGAHTGLFFSFPPRSTVTRPRVTGTSISGKRILLMDIEAGMLITDEVTRFDAGTPREI